MGGDSAWRSRGMTRVVGAAAMTALRRLKGPFAAVPKRVEVAVRKVGSVPNRRAECAARSAASGV
jgi:hypothetical protein